MSSHACLDAGPISLYYQKDPSQKIRELMESIKDHSLSAVVPDIILVEVYKHLCVAKGKDYATGCVRAFQYNFPVQCISLTPEIILDSGRLKCQYRTQLSYNDCIAIITALKMKATLHTTEKNFPKIHNLHVVSYDF